MSDAQSDVVDFLRGLMGGAELVETHGAFVLLGESEAWKIKRAVRYDYLDFSTPEKRRDMLLRELELNRPFAPSLYRDVVPVTQDRDGLALGGQGEPADWVLRMTRFRREDELGRVIARGDLDSRLAAKLGRSIALYHKAAARREADGAKLIGDIVDELARVFGTLGTDAAGPVLAACREALHRHSALLRERGNEGRIRRCHGDLHLGNIVMIEGEPTPFDALEFDETLGTCDILYDLAFLLMDLLHLREREAANSVLNAWLAEAEPQELAGLAALPLFLTIRAAIRAMVLLQTEALDHDNTHETDAADLLGLAESWLGPAPGPSLIAIGGLSGSGKSRLAARLATRIPGPLGAVLLRSDTERKAGAGLAPDEPLPREHYTKAASDLIYESMRNKAQAALNAGQSVVLDAVHADDAERIALEQIARRHGAGFCGLWLDAPQEILAARIDGRKGDASDATADVLARQIAFGIGDMTWNRIDASGLPEDVTLAAMQFVEKSCAGSRA